MRVRGLMKTWEDLSTMLRIIKTNSRSLLFLQTQILLRHLIRAKLEMIIPIISLPMRTLDPAFRNPRTLWFHL
jgi:hypothetical protein